MHVCEENADPAQRGLPKQQPKKAKARQWSYQSQGNDCRLRRSSERTIGLSAKTPHTPADPSQRHSLASVENLPTTIEDVSVETQITGEFRTRIHCSHATEKGTESLVLRR